MPYVITRSCCNDASCVPVCPVNCIHPTPNEPDYRTAEMLYIDPDVCIECGACMDVCPVSAIAPDYELPESMERYQQINARYYLDPENADYPQTANAPCKREWSGDWEGPLRVAVVGSGPSACYVAEELLETRGLEVSVDMFERLPVPFGLVRYGVAPDHQDTKVVAEQFGSLFRRSGFRLFLNVEIGTDISFEQLQDRYHAVVYAVGAVRDRRLGIEGEDLPGSHAATDFVAWYNGHPDAADREFDLSGERAVIVGNGNVALDVSRVLTADLSTLERSDIADHALEALRSSKIREVVVLGRRGPAEAAFTTPELLGLLATRGIHVRVEGAEGALREPADDIARLKAEVLDEAAATEPEAGDRTVTLRFLSSPAEVLGDSRVTGLRVGRNELVEEGGRTAAHPTGEVEDLDCGLVLRSVGYFGEPVPGLPFDAERGVVPNSEGKVVDPSGEWAGRAYVVGWIKRGPSGVIGTNKLCAQETVAALLHDVREGAIPRELAAEDDLESLVPDRLDAAAWKRIDRHERAAGRPEGRPRIKTVRVKDLVQIGRGDA
ncbi:4Fe-4S binding protein [Aeromicrobium sp. YIM 150415]|uniref:4Fe-4S binding protein n=1 Tax=Aeromicrobium sp. YIM 150415 TaxID=2803912 RepID=UPI001965D759|nr:4Fe-4S binding protein [Aeromicrobium sp. YIM 150415]MBM9464215.1 4Fe-4S binding protein [Aeromicrobium sp. YIM 150415]